jgi:glycosyltransferase involved in cell wall biosynthesis
MENPNIILTICIPSYNRATILQTIEVLLPQLTENVQIKIFDNCSDVPVSEILNGYIVDNIDIVRNSVNVGAAGNIIKCFEHCDTEWMWLLGDDDFPSSNAIETIFKTISTYPDVVYIKYNSNLGRIEDDVKVDTVSIGQQEFIHNMNNFCNLLFISSTVCRVQELKKGIKAAYYFTHTFSPHIAFVLSYLASNPNAKSLFSPLSVVRWDTPTHNDTWSFDVVNKSLSDFIYEVRGINERKELFDKINTYAPFTTPFTNKGFKGIIRTIVMSKKFDEEHNMIADYFSSEIFIYWAKSHKTYKVLFKLIFISAILLLLSLPFISNFLSLFIRDKSNIHFYYNRFSFFNKDVRL